MNEHLTSEDMVKMLQLIEKTGNFVDEFTFNEKVHETMQPHAEILAMLTGTALAMVEWDFQIGTDMAADAIRVAYHLGYTAGVNSVVYSDDEIDDNAEN